MNLKLRIFHATPLALRKIWVVYRLFTDKNSYLNSTGFLDSKARRELHDANGEPIPWMCYSIISFLRERLNKNLDVFEYGSGASTLFFAKRTRTVTSVEYDENWLERVEEMTKGQQNVRLVYSELSDAYAETIGRVAHDQKYNVIIIDGRRRSASAIASFNYLTEDGVLIFDDSYRSWYQRGIEYYTDRGFKRLAFNGLKPTGYDDDETTILYRENNCLGL